MPESGPQNGAGKRPRQQQAFRKTGPLSGSQNGPRFFAKFTQNNQPTQIQPRTPQRHPKPQVPTIRKRCEATQNSCNPGFENFPTETWALRPVEGSSEPRFKGSLLSKEPAVQRIRSRNTAEERFKGTPPTRWLGERVRLQTTIPARGAAPLLP